MEEVDSQLENAEPGNLSENWHKMLASWQKICNLEKWEFGEKKWRKKLEFWMFILILLCIENSWFLFICLQPPVSSHKHCFFFPFSIHWLPLSDALWDRKGAKTAAICALFYPTMHQKSIINGSTIKLIWLDFSNLFPFLSHNASEEDNQSINNKAYHWISAICSLFYPTRHQKGIISGSTISLQLDFTFQVICVYSNGSCFRLQSSRFLLHIYVLLNFYTPKF